MERIRYTGESMARAVTVSLSPMCIELLMAEGEDDQDPGRRLVAAVAYFLAEAGPGVAGSSYPDFRREDGEGPTRDFEFVIAADLWRRFAAAAERQRVSPGRLLEHAALFFAAQGDAGRFAERIAEGLDE